MNKRNARRSVTCVWLWEKGNYRTHNEDALCIRSVLTTRGICALYCICDGMGGYKHGAEASRIAMNRVEEWYDGQLLPLLEELSRHSLMLNQRMLIKIIKNSGLMMLLKVNEELFVKGRKEREVWGCTATICIVFLNRVYWFHIGDSAVFRLHQSGGRLTKCHRDKQGALTRCLGANRDGSVDFGVNRLRKNLFLMCSDGFLRHMSWEQIKEILCVSPKHQFPQYYQKRLQKIADCQMKYPKEDNMSAIIFGRV